MVESTSSRSRIVWIRCDGCGEPGRIDLAHPSMQTACRRCGRLLWTTAVARIAEDFHCPPQSTIATLQPQSMQGVIQELAAAAAQANRWTPEQQSALSSAMIQREALGSTGLGRGVAVPHASLDWIDRRVTVLAYAPLPIEFHALDGRPVHTLFMVASPKRDRADHVRYMERVTRLLRSIVEQD